jgi:hypothetical protein
VTRYDFIQNGSMNKLSSDMNLFTILHALIPEQTMAWKQLDVMGTANTDSNCDVRDCWYGKQELPTQTVTVMYEIAVKVSKNCQHRQ